MYVMSMALTNAIQMVHNNQLNYLLIEWQPLYLGETQTREKTIVKDCVSLELTLDDWRNESTLR